jgi:biopolymer transport protein ExbD
MSTSINPKNPTKLFLKVLLFTLFYLALCIVLHGCKAKPMENTHEVETVIASKKDSVKTTVISGAINDTLKIQLPKIQTAKPECDSITKAELQRVLQLLNSRKKSGDNEAGIYYDSLRNQIIAWQKIAQTKNVSTATNKEYIYLKGDKQIKYISVKYIPLWVKILASIGAMTLLFIVYRISRIFI